MIQNFFRFKKRNPLEQITLNNIENKMKEIGFSKELTDEILIILEKRFHDLGEKAFQKWFNELNFSVPEECKDESFATNLYEKHSLIIEEQVKELEKETDLFWETQTEDLKHLNEKARKVQLVIRHRLTEIAFDLIG